MAVEEPTTPAGGGLADALKRYVDAVAASTEAPRERAGKLMGDLAKRGEVRAKEIQKAAKELSERSARDRRDLMRLIQKEIRRQIDGLGLPRRTEIDRLTERLEKLESDSKKAKD